MPRDRRARAAARGARRADDLEQPLAEELAALLGEPGTLTSRASPAVILVVGVNGTGKTTTIGKLAAKLREHGHSVLLGRRGHVPRRGRGAARDLGASGPGADFVGAPRGGDPAAVAYDAIEAASARGRDVVIVDTAGRLHTQTNLMEELAKVRRVIAGQLEGAPHETLLVVDATTGQNGLQQARLFGEAVGVTGVALTKLDGSAKGGDRGRDRPRARPAGEAGRRRGGARRPAPVRPAATSRARSSRASGCKRPPTAYTSAAVFDTLSDKLQHALGDLRGRGRLDEESVSKAMREIRLALLEADVNLQVVKDFVARVKERAVGEEVTKSLTPGQQVVKIVHEELTAVMGGGDSRLAFAARPPTVILLAGLQGSGKTTAAAKLALMLRKDGQDAGARRRRPPAPGRDRPARAARPPDPGPRLRRGAQGPGRGGASRASRGRKEQGADVVIVDTAGRHQVDERPDGRARADRAGESKPTNVLLVLDAMTGQEAVNVAEAFQERVAFDGIVLTKLDGDARGGAALSVRAVTGRPIKLASIGEKLDQLEWFHPDRMASRILGMGDVLTLIEKAEEAVEADEQAEMEQRACAPASSRSTTSSRATRCCAGWAR